MAYINYRKNNPLYSPGVSTYTVKGEQGNKGNNGSSLYYTDGVIYGNESEESRINQCLQNGSILVSDESTEGAIEYKSGDLILDGRGDVYSITADKVGNLSLVNSVIGSVRQAIMKPFSINAKGEFIVKTLHNNLQDNYAFYEMKNDGSYISTSEITNNKKIDSGCVYIEVIDKVSGEVAMFKVKDN